MTVIIFVLGSLIGILVTLCGVYLYRRGSNQNQGSKSGVSSSELSSINVASAEPEMIAVGRADHVPHQISVTTEMSETTLYYHERLQSFARKDCDTKSITPMDTDDKAGNCGYRPVCENDESDDDEELPRS